MGQDPGQAQEAIPELRVIDYLICFINMVLLSWNHQFDLVCAISSSRVGMGKSTLSLYLTKKIYEATGRPLPRLQEMMFFNRAEIDKAIKKRPKNSVIILDEAITSFYKREFAHKQQIDLIKLFQVCRTRYHCFFLNIPYFWDLDKAIRDERIDYWLHIHDRGICFGFAPDKKGAFTKDPWHQKLNEKHYNKPYLYNRSSNFTGYFTFPNMEGEPLWDDYTEYQAKRKYNDGKKEEDLI